MSTPHTPGPWVAESCGCYATDTPGGRCIVYCPTHAAAPDMLAMLNKLVKFVSPRAEDVGYHGICRALSAEARTILARLENGG